MSNTIVEHFSKNHTLHHDKRINLPLVIFRRNTLFQRHIDSEVLPDTGAYVTRAPGAREHILAVSMQ